MACWILLTVECPKVGSYGQDSCCDRDIFIQIHAWESLLLGSLGQTRDELWY